MVKNALKMRNYQKFLQIFIKIFKKGIENFYILLYNVCNEKEI